MGEEGQVTSTPSCSDPGFARKRKAHPRGPEEEIEERRQQETQSITIEDIDELVEASARRAFGAQGSDERFEDSHSQAFHLGIRSAMAGCMGSALGRKRVGSLGDVICSIMTLTQDPMELCRPWPMAGRQDLFLIPVDDVTDDFSDEGRFLRALVFSLSSLAGHPLQRQTRGGRTSFGQKIGWQLW